MGITGSVAGRWRAGALGVLAVVAATLVSAPAAEAAFAPCADTPTFLCDTVPVPLDRSGAVPGTVNLSARIVPARVTPVRGTVLFIAGGPGQAATPVLPLLAADFGAVLPNYNLLTFDQRGTGRSGPLRCPAFDSPRRESQTRAAARCGKQLGPARTFYRTSDSVDDVEAVRAAIGGPPLAIFAVSYGSRVAGEYARRYPAGVSRLLLDSPTPLFGTDPLDLQRVRTLPRLLRSICARKSCPFTKSAFRDLSRLAGRLRRRPLKGRAFDSRGRARRVRLTLADLYGLTISSDLAASARAQLPSAYRSAVRGDPGPLLRLLVSPGFRVGAAQEEQVEELNFVTNTVTLCAESPFPWSPASAPGRGRDRLLNRRLNQLGARAFRPFGAQVVVGVGTVTPSCLRWPPVRPPAPVAPVGPPVPTLVLSGLEDFRTPIETARSVAAGYPNGQLLPIPYAGHSLVGTDPSGCAAFAGFTFLAGGTPLAACPPRPRLIPVAPRAPLTLRRLKPLGFKGVRGRTIRATTRTIDDALAQVIDGSGSVRAGGLRGGRLAFDARTSRLALAGYEYLPDVKVTGTLQVTAGPRLSGRLRVRGGGTRRAVLQVSADGRVQVRFTGGARGALAPDAVRVEPFRLVRVPRALTIGP
ncbi:MAG: alpha/beta hydrolase [Actinomycetota bacterium]|nr:alpha/beta hydrolase [Actinomycetota bacterium]